MHDSTADDETVAVTLKTFGVEAVPNTHVYSPDDAFLLNPLPWNVIWKPPLAGPIRGEKDDHTAKNVKLGLVATAFEHSVTELKQTALPMNSLSVWKATSAPLPRCTCSTTVCSTANHRGTPHVSVDELTAAPTLRASDDESDALKTHE